MSETGDLTLFEPPSTTAPAPAAAPVSDQAIRPNRIRYLEGMIVVWRHGAETPTAAQRAAARELATEMERRIREG